MLNTNLLKSLFAILLTGLLFTACTEESVNGPEETTSETEALYKLLEEDEAALSFDPAYDEEDAMELISPKVSSEIFPVRVGQRMRVTDFNFDVTIEDDSAFATLTKYYDGKMFIAASFDEFENGDTNVVDTLIEKEFSTKVTRKYKYLKVANTAYPRLNWRLVAISLPEGGTLTEADTYSENIQIMTMTLTLESGDIYTIDNPNEFYFEREINRTREFPRVNVGEEVKLQVTVFSQYEEEDFVTLTYGARRGGFNRAKKMLELVSSEFNGNGYTKVYEATYVTHQFPGIYHGIVNALPDQVINDDATLVEEHSWGIPYRVN